MATSTTSGAAPVDEGVREQRALAWAAIAALLAILWLVRPIGLGILVGVLLAFIAQPVYARLRVRIGPRWGSLATVFASGLAIAIALGVLGWVFVARGTALSARLVASVGAEGLVDRLIDRASMLTARFGISADDLRGYVQDLAGHAAAGLARAAQAIAAATASALLGLFFALLAMHLVLRQGETMSRRLAETLPLRPDYTLALLAEFKAIGRSTLLGSVATAIVQGAFAALGFEILGVPEPLWFGALTAIASFIPAVGVLVVLVPVALGLALAGHGGAALLELAWGVVFVIGVPDYLIRPRLVRGETKVPPLATFASLFGGVEVLGLSGLLVGPVVMAVALAVLRLYSGERARRVEPTS